MKHIFIMNPAAGKGKAGKVFLPRIIETSKRMGIDYEIHRTMGVGDARHFVDGRCRASDSRQCDAADGQQCDVTEASSGSGETLRFYACGGDGTLNEVANGAYGHKNVEIAMIPAGTGNDFPRCFGDLRLFEEMESQISGKARPVDLIRCSSGGDVVYGINMINIGLDCDVVDQAARIKEHPFVPRPLAYGLGVGIVLGKKEGVNLEIALDNGEKYNGDFTLVAIGNGRYCGGGFQGVPRASVDDGLLDVSIIRSVSRRTFVSLLGKYRKGTHLEDPKTADLISYIKCKSLTVQPPGQLKICNDGEISMVGEITFEIVPGAVNFSVPRGCE